MAAPTYFGNSSATSNLASFSLAWPAGHQANDVGILVIETDGVGTTLTPAGGWAHVTGSPITDVATAAGSKLHVLWKRAASGAEANVSITDSGDHQTARIHVIRGCIASGNPWDVITTGTKTTASTSVTLPSISPTYAGTLYVGIVSRPDDSAILTSFGAPVNSLLTFTTDVEGGSTTGNGGGFVFVAAQNNAAGPTGTTSLSSLATVTNAYVVMALKPPLQALTLVADRATLQDNGIDTGLTHNHRLAADAGLLALAGIPAELVKSGSPDVLAADSGALALTGADAGLARSVTMAAAPAALSLTGASATLLRTLIPLAADLAALTLFAPAAELAVAHRLTANTQAFSLAGEAVLFAISEAVDGGTFQLAGEATDLRVSRTLAAGSGSLAFSGTASDLHWIQGYDFNLDAEAFSIAGSAVQFARTYKITATESALALSGSAAQLPRSWQLSAICGSLSLAGPTITLAVSRFLSADFAALALTGALAELLQAENVLGGRGAFDLAAAPANLTVQRRLLASKSTFTVTNFDADLAKSAAFVLTAEGRSLVVTGNALAVGRTWQLTAASLGLNTTPAAVSLKHFQLLAASPADFQWIGNTVAFPFGSRLQTTPGALTAAGLAVTFNRSRIMPVTGVGHAFTGQATTFALRRRKRVLIFI